MRILSVGARAVLGICCAVLLSGCLASDAELWPVRSGEKLSLSPGEYECISYAQGERQSAKMAVREMVSGKDLYYEIDEEGKDPYPASFHKIQDDMYVISTAIGESFANVYARVSNEHLLLFEPLEAQVQEYAEKHGVSVHLLTFDADQPDAKLRAFIISLGKNLDMSNVMLDCGPID